MAETIYFKDRAANLCQPVAMTRFYMQLRECGTVLEDEEGRELADLEAATVMAIREARDIMSSEVKAGKICLSCVIVIQDESRAEVGRVAFRDALTLVGV